MNDPLRAGIRLKTSCFGAAVMSKPQVGRFFLVGTPRSGTTLYQCILAAHPQVFSCPETNFFLDLVPKRNPVARLLGLATPPGRRNYQRFRQWALKDANVDAPKPRLFVRKYANSFVRTLDEATTLQGKTHWLEKSPVHLRSIETIKRHVPRARFLHLIRRGPDNIASLYDVTQKNREWWGTKWSLEYCVQYWIDDARISLQYQNDPSHLVVTYNEVVDVPNIAITRACEFMGLPFDPAMLTNYAQSADQVVEQGAVWKAGVRQSIQSQDGAKFARLFTPEQQEYILQRVASVDFSAIHQD